jgi:hypothetical protein
MELKKRERERERERCRAVNATRLSEERKRLAMKVDLNHTPKGGK